MAKQKQNETNEIADNFSNVSKDIKDNILETGIGYVLKKTLGEDGALEIIYNIVGQNAVEAGNIDEINKILLENLISLIIKIGLEAKYPQLKGIDTIAEIAGTSFSDEDLLTSLNNPQIILKVIRDSMWNKLISSGIEPIVTSALSSSGVVSIASNAASLFGPYAPAITDVMPSVVLMVKDFYSYITTGKPTKETQENEKRAKEYRESFYVFENGDPNPFYGESEFFKHNPNYNVDNYTIKDLVNLKKELKSHSFNDIPDMFGDTSVDKILEVMKKIYPDFNYKKRWWYYDSISDKFAEYSEKAVKPSVIFDNNKPIFPKNYFITPSSTLPTIEEVMTRHSKIPDFLMPNNQNNVSIVMRRNRPNVSMGSAITVDMPLKSPEIPPITSGIGSYGNSHITNINSISKSKPVSVFMGPAITMDVPLKSPEILPINSGIGSYGTSHITKISSTSKSKPVSVFMGPAITMDVPFKSPEILPINSDIGSNEISQTNAVKLNPGMLINYQNVQETADVNKIVKKLKDILREQIRLSAEGAYK